MEISIPYLGTVTSRKELKIIARVSGRVTELPYREGESTAQSGILARIDAPEIKAQVERLSAERGLLARRHEADKGS
jgi:multidrug resistance efflux pump